MSQRSSAGYSPIQTRERTSSPTNRETFKNRADECQETVRDIEKDRYREHETREHESEEAGETESAREPPNTGTGSDLRIKRECAREKDRTEY